MICLYLVIRLVENVAFILYGYMFNLKKMEVILLEEKERMV